MMAYAIIFGSIVVLTFYVNEVNYYNSSKQWVAYFSVLTVK